MSVVGQLDRKVFESTSRGLSINDLLDYQGEIASLRYTLSEEIAVAELKMLRDKEHSENHALKSRLGLQAQMKGLSTAKADDMVRDQEDTELLRLSALQSKAEHTRLKLRLDTSGDVLVSLAQRIKRLENEEMTSRFQAGR